MKNLLTSLAVAVLKKTAPDVLEAEILQVTPALALDHLLSRMDKNFGSAWNKTPVPTDTVEVIMYRAGIKTYREQLMKEIDATSKAGWAARP